jgi:hypothetical protein
MKPKLTLTLLILLSLPLSAFEIILENGDDEFTTRKGFSILTTKVGA